MYALHPLIHHQLKVQVAKWQGQKMSKACLGGPSIPALRSLIAPPLHPHFLLALQVGLPSWIRPRARRVPGCVGAGREGKANEARVLEQYVKERVMEAFPQCRQEGLWAVRRRVRGYRSPSSSIQAKEILPKRGSSAWVDGLLC